MCMMTFRSHAKLMITAEYTVLSGALALAMPLRFGQGMRVSHHGSAGSIVEWNSRVLGSDYLRFRMAGPQLHIADTGALQTEPQDSSHTEDQEDVRNGSHGGSQTQSQEDTRNAAWHASKTGSPGHASAGDGYGSRTEDQADARTGAQNASWSGAGEISGARREASARFIRSVLLAARQCKPSFLSEPGLWKVFSEVDFDLEWGLGSSSSLISNIAWWAGISPFELHFKVSEGSAYDIACARSPQPILFTYKGKDRLPDFRPVCFDPPFGDRLFFVYSGRKQDSAKSIRHFSPEKVGAGLVREISHISLVMSSTASLDEFMECMRRHEELTAGILRKERVQRAHFPAFPGQLKSLGAWGGDFLLAASHMEESDLIQYFADRGHEVVIPFNKMKIQP